MFILIAGRIFVGPLGALLGGEPVLIFARPIPSYYLADGLINATQNLGRLSTNLLDIAIVLGSSIIFLVFWAWVLRR